MMEFFFLHTRLYQKVLTGEGSPQVESDRYFPNVLFAGNALSDQGICVCENQVYLYGVETHRLPPSPNLGPALGVHKSRPTVGTATIF